MLPKIVEALKTDPTGWYKANKLNPALVAWYGHSPARRLDEATPDQHQRDSAAQEEHSTGGGHRDSMAMTERDQSRQRWTHFATTGLGLWPASSPLLFRIQDADSVPSRGAPVTEGGETGVQGRGRDVRGK